MPYQISGSTASIAPFAQKWVDIQTGTDHHGRPILAAAKHVELQFDQMSVAHYQQWSALHGASLTSCQILNIDGASFTTYNNTGLHFAITQRPEYQAGNVTAWTATIYNIAP